MAKKIAKGTPVKVESPRGINASYKGQLGIVKGRDLLIGRIWSYKVRLNSGREVWFDENELKVLRNT